MWYVPKAVPVQALENTRHRAAYRLLARLYSSLLWIPDILLQVQAVHLNLPILQGSIRQFVRIVVCWAILRNIVAANLSDRRDFLKRQLTTSGAWLAMEEVSPLSQSVGFLQRLQKRQNVSDSQVHFYLPILWFTQSVPAIRKVGFFNKNLNIWHIFQLKNSAFHALQIIKIWYN